MCKKIIITMFQAMSFIKIFIFLDTLKNYIRRYVKALKSAQDTIFFF